MSRRTDDPRFAEVDERDPKIAKGMELQRHLTAKRSAATRARNGERAKDDPVRRLVDVSTGELIEQGLPYREGNVTEVLPLGMTPADVPLPACNSDFTMVCRALYRSTLEYLRDRKLPAGMCLLWAGLVIEADPLTGAVDLTSAEAARRYRVDQSTAHRWMAGLANEGLVDLRTVPGGHECTVTVLNYDEVVRLDIRQRIRQGEQRLRRRVIERETVTTVRERVVEDFR